MRLEQQDNSLTTELNKKIMSVVRSHCNCFSVVALSLSLVVYYENSTKCVKIVPTKLAYRDQWVKWDKFLSRPALSDQKGNKRFSNTFLSSTNS